MKRDTYRVLFEKYQSINENWGWSGPEEVTWTRYNDATKQKEKVATVIFDKGRPQGYEFLGYGNSGIEIPKANDWLVWGSGNTEHYLSPSLKVWYTIDTSG